MSNSLPDFAAKSPQALRQLRENAEAVLADPRRAKQHEAARRMIAALPARAATTSSRTRRGDALTDEALEQLTGLAREVAAAFDTRPPEGTPGAHKPIAAGQLKVGGDQRTKKAAVHRYISHRRGDEIAAISWRVDVSEDPGPGGRWLVRTGGLHDADRPMPDFVTAKEAFLERLEAIGTPRLA